MPTGIENNTEKSLETGVSQQENVVSQEAHEAVKNLMDELNVKGAETDAMISEMGGEEKLAESLENFDDTQKAAVMTALEKIQSKRAANQEVIDTVKRIKDPQERALGLTWYKGIKDTYYKIREALAK